jgi:hypothetical protein
MKAGWTETILTASVLVGAAASPAAAQRVTLTANMTGGGETPAIVTGSFGSATVIVNVPAQTISYRVDVVNLPSGATGGHIHVGPKEIVSGPIIFNFNVPNNISNDFSVSGAFSCADVTLRPDQGIRSCEDAIQAVAGGNAYVNVHSAVNPGGEIRGQLIVKQ